VESSMDRPIRVGRIVAGVVLALIGGGGVAGPVPWLPRALPSIGSLEGIAAVILLVLIFVLGIAVLLSGLARGARLQDPEPA